MLGNILVLYHLGIHKIKSELEDLSLRYLKPDVFYDIAEKLNKTKIERDILEHLHSFRQLFFYNNQLNIHSL